MRSHQPLLKAWSATINGTRGLGSEGGRRGCAAACGLKETNEPR
jgi:hypothetical protein